MWLLLGGEGRATLRPMPSPTRVKHSSPGAAEGLLLVVRAAAWPCGSDTQPLLLRDRQPRR